MGTGKWFLDTKEFEAWLKGEGKILFCPGIPGAGKTMMASIVIDHISHDVCRQNACVSYLFCNYKGTAELTVSDLLAAVLKQLLRSRPDISNTITDMCGFCSARDTKPSFSQVVATVQIVCTSYNTVYIIVDALDECDNTNGTRDLLIQELLSLQKDDATDVRLMFTSRFIPDITQAFGSSPTLEVKASEEDVESFVVGQMPHLPRCVQRDKRLRRMAQNKIVEAVDAMWVFLQASVLFLCR